MTCMPQLLGQRLRQLLLVDQTHGLSATLPSNLPGMLLLLFEQRFQLIVGDETRDRQKSGRCGESPWTHSLVRCLVRVRVNWAWALSRKPLGRRR